MEASAARGVSAGAIAVDRVRFRGHPMVRALHPTTIEVTMDEALTERGDCIVGVGAEKGCAGVDERVKARVRKGGARVRFRLVVGREAFSFSARGDPRLTLSHSHDIVVRRSDYVSDRTIAVGADAAAVDIPRSIVASLRDPGATGYLEVAVE